MRDLAIENRKRYPGFYEEKRTFRIVKFESVDPEVAGSSPVRVACLFSS